MPDEIQNIENPLPKEFDKTHSIPNAWTDTATQGLSIRKDLIDRKRILTLRCSDLWKALKRKPSSSDSLAELHNELSDCQLEQSQLEQRLQSEFLPLHSPRQFISPRAFFVSPLFRVAARKSPRKAECEITLTTDANGHPIIYSGPELRQEDGLVFMALVNIVRDFRLGTVAHFVPGEMCQALFGHYDGRARNRLKEYILRLLKGHVRTHRYAVPLCQRFDYPARGSWSVALDADIVHLFAKTHVWLDLQLRLELPDGLTTWLYGYVEAQSRLIPTRIDTLRRLCGSSAEIKPFTDRLRKALEHLQTHQIIDAGYRIKAGQVHWRKPMG